MKTGSVQVRGAAVFVILFVVGVALAAALGGVFNAINGRVSPLYFATIIGWTGVSNIWWASIEQGIKQATLIGCVLSALLSIGLAVMSRGKCPLDLGLHFLMGVFAAISLCWTFGGIVAIWMVLKYTAFYRQTFIGVPDEVGEMVRYAWVGGSIWGAYAGSVLSIAVAFVIFRARRKRHYERNTAH